MSDIQTERYTLLLGDCLERLKQLPDNSVDALVTDPPSSIGLMGLDWDSDKGGSKEWINWLSQIMVEVNRVLKPGAHGFVWALPRTSHYTAMAMEWAGFEIRDGVTHLFGSGFCKHKNALKPSGEIWWLVRKELSEKNIADNISRWGTGGINVDRSRIGNETRFNPPTHKAATAAMGDFSMCKGQGTIANGRWPTNTILDEEVAESLERLNPGVSRYFYVAKPSRWERDVGLDGLPEGVVRNVLTTHNGGGDYRGVDKKPLAVRRNIHATVKPFALMRYLVRMITPPGENSTILDCFLGSGTTGAVAVACGFKFIGIEKELEYLEISKRRIADVRLPEPTKG